MKLIWRFLCHANRQGINIGVVQWRVSRVDQNDSLIITPGNVNFLLFVERCSRDDAELAGNGSVRGGFEDNRDKITVARIGGLHRDALRKGGNRQRHLAAKVGASGT